MNDEERAALARAVIGHVRTLDAAVNRFRASEEPSDLYGEAIERASTRIVTDARELGGAHLREMISGFSALAWLHYSRFAANPMYGASYLWSATRLFRMVRSVGATPSMPSAMARMLDVLEGGGEEVPLPIDDPTTASRTAELLIMYAETESDTRANACAVNLLRGAVSATPAGHADGAALQANLLGSLVKQLELGAEEVVDEIVELADSLVSSATLDDPRWPDVVALAGSALLAVATRREDLASTEQAIALLRRGVDNMPEPWPGKAGALTNLGRAELQHTGERSPSMPSDRAVNDLRHAVSVSEPGDPGFGDRLCWLALALLSGEPARPDLAAAQLETALALDGIFGANISNQLLGNALFEVWRAQPGNERALDQAIVRLTAAETDQQKPTPEDSNAVADALWARWERTSKIEDVDGVISRLTKRTGRADAPSRVLNLLARALGARWERTGDSAAIRAAIDTLEIVVNRSQSGSATTCMYLNNLGSMWLRLHQATGEEHALLEGIRITDRALDEAPVGDRGRPMYANNSAAAHLIHWRDYGNVQALERAGDTARRAVMVTPERHPGRTGHHVNLGMILYATWNATGDRRSLDGAIAAFDSELRRVGLSSRHSGGLALGLGQALLDRGRLQNDVRALRRGTALLRASCKLPHVRVEDAIGAGRRWAEEAAEAQDWNDAAQALSTTVGSLARLPGHRLDRTDHERVLIRLSGLARDAAAACLSAGDAHSALENLELGRGVLLAKTVSQDDEFDRLRRKDPGLVDRLIEVRNALAVLPRHEP